MKVSMMEAIAIAVEEIKNVIDNLKTAIVNRIESMTAEDVSALPIKGGTITGNNVQLNNGRGRVATYSTGTFLEHLDNAGDTSSGRQLIVRSATGNPNKPAISDAVLLKDLSSDTSYAIYGEHNIPSASVIGAVPNTGGEISGDVTIRKNSPVFKLENTNAPTGSAVTVEHFAGGGGGVYLLVDANTYSGLRFNPVSTDEEGNPVLSGNEFCFNVKGANYTAYGSHNKPSGTYPGGTVAKRDITVGGNGSVLMISSSYGVIFVTFWGAVGITYSTTGVSQKTSGNVCFRDGVLKIGETDLLYNYHDATYTYQVL